MKGEKKLLLAEVGKTVGKTRTMAADVEKLIESLTRKYIPLQLPALKKVWTYVRKAEHLSPQALDRLALFAGFQSWKDFQRTLHGDDDGLNNYGD